MADHRLAAWGFAPTGSSLVAGQPLHGAPAHGRTLAVACLAGMLLSDPALPTRPELTAALLERLRRQWRTALLARPVSATRLPLPDLCPWASTGRPRPHPKEAARRPRRTNPNQEMN